MSRRIWFPEGYWENMSWEPIYKNELRTKKLNRILKQLTRKEKIKRILNDIR